MSPAQHDRNGIMQITTEPSCDDRKAKLFASLIAAAVLVFAAMAFVATGDRNPKDKTLEKAQEKQERDLVSQKMTQLVVEAQELTERLQSENSQSEKQRIGARLDEIRGELDKIESDNRVKDVPQAQLDELLGQQVAFGERLMQSDAVKFVVAIGIDLSGREIQVVLNESLVGSHNIDSIINDLQKMMPANANWHVVLSGGPP